MSVELSTNMTLGEVRDICRANGNCQACELYDLDEGACALEDTIAQWNLRETVTVEQTNNPVSPAHYQQGKRQTLDEMIVIFGLEAVKAFCLCNVYKYKTRAGLKNGHEDLAKADRYLTFYEHLCEYGHIKWYELEG